MNLSEIIPWGRSFAEYREMFELDKHEMNMKILGCGDGPASFNGEANGCGSRVVSCDPIYQFSATEIATRIEAALTIVREQLEMTKEKYIWSRFTSVDGLCADRMHAMQTFLHDYPHGREEGRYITGSLPQLPFEDREFDLALVSHFLFLYSKQLSLEFHHAALNELLRVADEVRIYPLVTLEGEDSVFLAPVIEMLAQNPGISCEKVKVSYRFQRNAEYMLRIRKTTNRALPQTDER